MKDMNWWDWLFVGEIIIMAFWLAVVSMTWAFELVVRFFTGRDFEQEAVDRVLNKRTVSPGQTIIITYKNGVTVTISRPS